MKIFKKNNIFYFFKSIGFFIGNSSNIFFQKYSKYLTHIYCLSDNKYNKYLFFFNFKNYLKFFFSKIYQLTQSLILGYFLEILIIGIGFKC